RAVHQVVDRRVEKDGRFLGEGFTAQVLFDAPRQRIVDQIIDFAINPFTRDKNLFDEGKLIIVLINFTFDESPDLLASFWTGRDLSQVMDDGRDLLIDAGLN